MTPEPSLCGTIRGNGIGLPSHLPRFFVSPGFTPERATRTRTSPGPASGSGISPTWSTSAAGPGRWYQAASTTVRRLLTRSALGVGSAPAALVVAIGRVAHVLDALELGTEGAGDGAD